MAEMPGGNKDAIAREGRPVDGSYCVLSVNDSAKGITITAYDSEALTEKEIAATFDQAARLLGDEAKGLSTEWSVDKKQPLYQRLLKEFVLLKGSGKSQVLQLSSGEPYQTAEGLLFDAPGEESQVLSPVPATPETRERGGFNDSARLPASSPIVKSDAGARPSTSSSGPRKGRKGRGGMDATGGSAGAGARPKTTGHGMRGSKSQGSMKVTSMRPIAGYKPPTDLSGIGETVLERAQALMDNDRALFKRLKDPVFVMAANQVGVDTDELKPRDIWYFRTGPTTVERLTMMKGHYDKQRKLNLSLALMEYDKAAAIVKERQDRAERHHHSLSEGFLKTIETEKKRLESIALNRSKIETVAENENVLLRARRKKFEERMSAAGQRQAKLDEMRSQQREFLAKKSEKRQELIKRVQVQKEERQAERIRQIRESSSSRNDVLERHERTLLERQAAKEARLKEREVERARKRDDVTASQQLRKQMLTEQLHEKYEASAIIRKQREGEVASKQGERWRVAKTRQDNAQRVRREKEFHQKQVMHRIKASYEVMDYMKELRGAVVEKRRANKREMIINVDKWKDKTTLERSITPGPGEYDNRSSVIEVTGGSWSRYKPKSDLEWQIYRASQLPGPGEYKEADINGPSGGTWGKYAPKSDVEWQIYRASQIPGPGDYEPRELQDGFQVTFGQFNPKTDLDIIIARAKTEPGPADYAERIPDIEKPSLKKMQKKLKKAAKKLQIAQAFVSKTKKAAGESRRRSVEVGVKVHKGEVTPQHVRQTKAMMKAVDHAGKAEEAALAGDLDKAGKHAEKATLAAKQAERHHVATGIHSGKAVTDGTDVVVGTAMAAAEKAERAHKIATKGKAQAEAKAAKAASDAESDAGSEA